MDDAAYYRIQELYERYMRFLPTDMYALVRACENDPLVSNSLDSRVHLILSLFKIKLTENRNWKNDPNNQFFISIEPS